MKNLEMKIVYSYDNDEWASDMYDTIQDAADYYHGNFIRPYIHEVEIIPYIDYWAPIAPLPKDGD